MTTKKKFKTSDIFQQMVGGILLAGPFIVTEEVWRIAANMRILQIVIIILLNILTGYFALFYADKTRDPNVEQDIFGIPVRLISLELVAYIGVIVLIVLIGANTTFGADFQGLIASISICSIFSLVGAATADSIF